MSQGIRSLWVVMLLPVSGTFVMAQHGYGGGAHAAGIGHFAIGTAGVPSAIGHMPSAIGFSPSPIGGSAPVYGNRLAGSYSQFSQGRDRYRGSPEGPWRRDSRYGRFNNALPYAYFGTPYYFPFLDSSYSSFDSNDSAAYPSDPQGGTAAYDAGLSEQVQQLSAQINGLQDQLAQRTRPSPPPEDGATSAAIPPSPPLTVVLNGGQVLEVNSYAVMGDTFWDFSRQPARKIPLSKIDVPASTQASEAKGAEFPQLNAGR